MNRAIGARTGMSALRCMGSPLFMLFAGGLLDNKYLITVPVV